jgi:uncharacterized repeat protein (TIGR03806 family)
MTLANLPARFERAFGKPGFVWLLLHLALTTVTAADGQRPLWINTRLSGSPEPPSPYTVERAFTQIEWKNPMYVAPEPGTERLWVVLQGGEKDRPSRIVRLQNQADAPQPETVLSIPGRLMYGLTFHPGFRTNGFVFVFSNGPTPEPERTNRVSRFTVSRSAPFGIDPASEQIIIAWRSAGHDGGDLAFGRDGMLYITSGDGTSDSDGWDSGQDMTRLLAKLLRIDVDHPPAGRMYAVPGDNPFVNLPGARPETWAYGFRNPWRMGIDERTGDIWVGQNGQDLWESSHLVRRGDNIGWSVFEAGHPFYPNRRRGPTPVVLPTIEHHHSEFRSLTGGVVYYGNEFPELNGTYIYGDYATGRIWGARHRDGKLVWHQELADTQLQIAAFRVDQHGQLLIVDHGGGLYRLIKRPEETPRAPFPVLLSETGLFTSTKDHRPEPGLISYSVNAPGWTDGAEAERFLALPGAARIQYASTRGWTFTNGTVLVQTLSLDSRTGEAASRKRIETRILLRQDGEWAGYSYRWNADQSDARLVAKEGENLELSQTDAAGAARRQTWRIPSRTECLTCHARAVNFVLGLSEAQMNRAHDYAGKVENQLAAFTRWDLFTNAPNQNVNSLARLANPYDEREDLDKRARAYLHANCSVCHVEAGGGNAKMELESSRTREQMNLVGARPQHDSFGITNAMLVAPGEPDRSVLLQRISRRGRGQMPPLVTARVDERAAALMRQWIAGMKSEETLVREWTMGDLQPALPQLDRDRSPAAGKLVFQKTGCVQCHRVGGEGGSVGPDLTGVGRRLDRRALLESILEPSKVIADEYAVYEIERRDGETVTGRIEREDDRELTLRTGSAVEELVRIAKTDVRRRTKSSLSNMPAGIVNVLQKDQILDLLAYLISAEAGGKTSGGN